MLRTFLVASLFLAASASASEPPASAGSDSDGPAPRPSLQQIAQWIVDLDNAEFVVRENASDELERAGERAEALLWKQLRERPSLELKHRIDHLLTALGSKTSYEHRHAVAYHMRGLESMKICMWREAREDFSRALRLDPTFAPAYLRRAQVSCRLEEYAEAWSDLDRAVEHEPRSLDLRIYQVLALIEAPEEARPDLAKARSTAENVCELTGGRNAECLQVLAAVHARTADFEKALHWQKLALELLPEKERTGYALRRLERYQKKQVNIIDFDPENIDAVEALDGVFRK